MRTCCLRLEIGIALCLVCGLLVYSLSFTLLHFGISFGLTIRIFSILLTLYHTLVVTEWYGGKHTKTMRGFFPTYNSHVPSRTAEGMENIGWSAYCCVTLPSSFTFRSPFFSRRTITECPPLPYYITTILAHKKSPQKKLGIPANHLEALLSQKATVKPLL